MTRRKPQHLRYRSQVCARNTDGPITTAADADQRDADALARFFRAILDKEPQTMTPAQKQLDEFTAGVQRLAARHPSLQLELDWNTAIAILSCLQLALRHPGNRGATAATVRGFCDALIAKIGEAEPRLAELLRLGDNPAHDT